MLSSANAIRGNLKLRALISFLCVLLFSTHVFASDIDYTIARFDRIVTAVRAHGPITLDGKLLEGDWSTAEPAANFIQWEPNPGAPATDSTEVRFLYDSSNLYIGARCFDSRPDRMVVNELKEDFQGSESDGFGIFLDTLHDLRSGFFFGTNPAGAKRDGQIFNDGDQMNMDWDGVWDVKTSRDDHGWTAEFIIPFKTLRFSQSQSQTWGLNIIRRVRRTNEDSHWSPLPRRYRVNRASMAGTLIGLEGISQGRNLKVKPYFTTGVTQFRSDDVFKRKFDRDGGVDLKYGLTQSLTLDLTYRTDFSQVEVDRQQVNLTRFNIFFPEKREFFLENSGLFSFGAGGGMGRGGPGGPGGSNLIPFFSRRIGLNADGNPVPILGGSRVSGKVGNYDVGFLAMKTDRVEGTPSNNFAVGRVKRNFMRNSWVGALVTNRDSSIAGDYNRVYGVDTNLRFREKLQVSSYMLHSDTPGKPGSNSARLLDVGWFDNDLSISGQYDEVQANFNPEVGFVRRKNVAHYSSDFSWRPRMQGSKLIRNFNVSTGADYFGGSNSGKVETRNQNINTGIFFQNSSSLNFNTFWNFDRLVNPFDIRSNISIPAGDYNYRRHAIFFNSDRSRAIAGNVFFNWGEFWNGAQTSIGSGLDLKPSYHLNIDLNYNRNQVKLANGAFTTNLVGTRVLYAFTSKMFLNAFVQYNADTHQVSSNIRFNIIHRPLSDLFIVYNDRRDTASGRLLDRAFVVKFTNLFNF